MVDSKIDFQEVVRRMKQCSLIRSDAELARFLGISPQALNNFKKRKDFPPSLLLRFREKTGASLDWIAYGLVYDYHPVNIINQANGDHPDGGLAVKESWITSRLGVSPKDIIAVMLDGDGMEPTLSQGELLFVDTTKKSGGDAIYALTINGVVVIKRVHRRMDGTLLVSNDNPKYPLSETMLEGDANIIGQVVWRCGAM